MHFTGLVSIKLQNYSRLIHLLIHSGCIIALRPRSCRPGGSPSLSGSRDHHGDAVGCCLLGMRWLLFSLRLVPIPFIYSSICFFPAFSSEGKFLEIVPDYGSTKKQLIDLFLAVPTTHRDRGLPIDYLLWLIHSSDALPPSSSFCLRSVTFISSCCQMLITEVVTLHGPDCHLCRCPLICLDFSILPNVFGWPRGWCRFK